VKPEETVARAGPLIGELGWAFYFVPETLARGKELGLDGFRFYFLGRGGVLGDVDAPVVHSALGYFAPALVERIWRSARERIAPPVAARAYWDCCAAFGRARLSKVPHIDRFGAAAAAVNDAADPVGLAVYSGIRSLPLADDPPARAMQLLTVLRELRGSAHLLAIRASGLDAKTAHFIRRPADIGTFGWRDDDAPAITDGERSQLAAADALTDRLVLPAFAALDDASRDELVAGLERIAAALAPA
jgi:hypothetical protein